MPIFLVSLADDEGFTRRNGTGSMIASAETGNDARNICKSQFTGFASDAAWESAVVTQLTDTAANAANALVDWVFRILVENPSDNSLIADVSVTGDATNDTLDEIGTALATALNGTASIANAAYTAGTQELIVAAGVGDALGNMRVTVEVTPPVVTDSNNVQTNDPKHIAGFIGSVVDEGLSNANLTVIFAGDAVVVPQVLATVQTT